MSRLLDQALSLTTTVKTPEEAKKLIWHLHTAMPRFSLHEQDTVRAYQAYLRRYICTLEGNNG
jgi:hypothetical protein